MDNIPSNPEARHRSRRKRALPLGLAAAGLLGGALVTTMTANAATTTAPSSTESATPGSTATPGSAAPEATKRRGSHGTETAITGAVADKVKAAVLVKYPGAKVNLVETDSNGGYEAEIVTAKGEDIHVSVSDAFVVGEVRGGPGGPGGGGHGVRGHSNTDPAHEAGESAARAAQEKAADATATPAPASPSTGA
jgi:hypothetical protein